MHKPLLVPHGLQRAIRHLTQQVKNVGSAEGLKSGLVRNVEVRVTRIKRYLVSQQPLCSGQVSLIRKVRVDVGAEVATALDIARARDDVGRKGTLSVLASETRREVGEVVGPG